MWFPDNPNWDWHGQWNGWDAKLGYIQEHAGNRPIWVTETGIATFDLAQQRISKYELQLQKLQEAAAAPADQLYWYTLFDLDPAREAIEGFHIDENEYHMGLINHYGERKPAFDQLKELLWTGGTDIPVGAGSMSSSSRDSA
jgi:CDP-paratose 2-epimerase